MATKTKAVVSDTEYTADEIIEASEKVFNGAYTKALVVAAFKRNGIKSITIENAKKIVESFAGGRIEGGK